MSEKETAIASTGPAGAVFSMQGELVFHVPVTEPGTGSDFVVKKTLIHATVLESGELELTSNKKSDNGQDAIKRARKAHMAAIKELETALEKTVMLKAEAEEKYSVAQERLDGDSDDPDGAAAAAKDGGTASPGGEDGQGEDDDACKALADAVLKLTSQERSQKRKLAKLKKVTSLKVVYTTQGGTTATLRPRELTAVSFLPTPIVWLPMSETPAEAVSNVVMVPVMGSLTIMHGYKSRILNEDMLEMLSEMLPESVVGKKLQMLIDSATAGQAAASFDPVVRPKPCVLTVIQSNTGHVFGGFLREPMGSGSGWHWGHPDDFVFALPTKSAPGGAAQFGGFGGFAQQQQQQQQRQVTKPVKLVKDQATTAQLANSRGIHRGCGLHMTDLTAFCSHSTTVPSVFNVVAEGFDPLPPGCSVSGNPGAFTPVYMEVYQVRE